ncbi:serine/threonine-protein kinase TTK/MPS1 [Nematocida minor]|uniref:serine/threonine-protein kinase TTK/MPS1 n=1 Tax=Nematocida minor TaxID=1912983 RepID=UPI00221ECD6F|nr:serine/threonine-protein kinase TTK/MPS1 [Nematocida minor]KAI5192131.1 serine/threonine-protein kinase TTK/MPS1 [Nematocida minor]
MPQTNTAHSYSPRMSISSHASTNIAENSRMGYTGEHTRIIPEGYVRESAYYANNPGPGRYTHSSPNISADIQYDNDGNRYSSATNGNVRYINQTDNEMRYNSSADGMEYTVHNQGNNEVRSSNQKSDGVEYMYRNSNRMEYNGDYNPRNKTAKHSQSNHISTNNSQYRAEGEFVQSRVNSSVQGNTEIEYSRSDSLVMPMPYNSAVEMPHEYKHSAMLLGDGAAFLERSSQNISPVTRENIDKNTETPSDHHKQEEQYYDTGPTERREQRELHAKNSESAQIAESEIRKKQSGTITSTGDVFDLPIGRELTESPALSAKPREKESAEASSADKYFNLTAPKKITLNGRRLRILRTIGKGGSAKVYQVLSDKNEVFALKKIKISQETEDSEVYKSYVNEISFLKRLKNRHEIVTLKDSYVNRDRIAILMEYGDIDLCRFLELEKAKFPGGYRKSNENYTMISLWEQMLRAVKCIHEHRIVHRDLKPGNFLFVNGRLKLIDFGISNEIRNDTTNIIREKQIGTINYMSPEAIIEGKTKMGRNSDIWSLGCILYEMYFGESPFMRFNNLVQRMQKLLDPEYVVEMPQEEEDDNGYPAIIAEIQKCLVREPRERTKIDVLLKSGICSRSAKDSKFSADDKCSFTRSELRAFVSKIMDLRHTATTEEGHEKIIEKITNLYFENPSSQ